MSLLIDPEVKLSLLLSQSSVKSGGRLPITVQLEKPAPAGGLTVYLASDNSAAAAPLVSHLVIPAGQTTTGTGVKAGTVTANTTVHISATIGSTAAEQVLTVTP